MSHPVFLCLHLVGVSAGVSQRRSHGFRAQSMSTLGISRQQRYDFWNPSMSMMLCLGPDTVEVMRFRNESMSMLGMIQSRVDDLIFEVTECPFYGFQFQ